MADPLPLQQSAMPLALAVVLLAGNMARGAILCCANLGSLPFRHDTIGLCPIFHLVHVFLPLVQPVCFSLVQLPVRSPLIDPLILLRLPLIDHRRFCLGKDHSGHQHGHRTDCEQHPLHPDLHEVWMSYTLARKARC